MFCVGELADQGAGHPDFGLYTAKQVQKGRPRKGQTPERGVVEVKPPAEYMGAPQVQDQVVRYLNRYGLVLATNFREFELVGVDASGGEVVLESFILAGTEEEFWHKLDTPRAFANEVGGGLCEYLIRALSHQAAISEPKDLAWLLASYARDALARVEAADDPKSLEAISVGAGRVARRPLRGGARRAFFQLHSGADPLLRHFLRMGTMGAANTGAQERV